MRNFFNSFYARLSAVFLVLLLILGIVQIYIAIQSSLSYVRQADQQVNAHLAADLAKEFSPYLQDSIDFKNIEHQIHYMMIINPRIEIYLLNNKGNIVAFFAEPKKKVQQNHVELQAIDAFISGKEAYPVLGDDPRHPGRTKVFSAAHLNIGEHTNGYIYIILGGEQYDSATGRLREGFIAQTTVKGLVISLAFAGILGLVLFSVLTKRLHRMTGVVTEFERGNFSRRIPVNSRDEIGQLARSFNQMADTIVKNMEDLKNTDRLRRELIANVSHDLRSPLASIQGYLETILIKESSLSASERREYLETIFNNTTMLSKLVNELFDLSKLDAQQVKPRTEPFSIVELIQDVAMKFNPQAEQKDIQLEAVIPQELLMVNADIAMIERVISNLIENALNYTDHNGKVKVEPLRIKEKIRIKIHDTGCGIRQEDIPHIFERFYRVDKSRRSKGGTGLGLAIAKKIVELHDQDLKVESRLNVGTTFYFDLNVWNPH